MAQPKRRTAAQARKHLLQTAETLFDREGFAGLSVRRLADEAGYSPTALYKHFNSKDDLVLFLKDAFFSRVIETMERREREGDTALAKLEISLRIYISEALKKPRLYAAAFADESGVGPHSGTPVLPSLAPTDTPKLALEADSERALSFGHFLERVTAVVGADRPFPDDPMTTAQSLWASLHGLVHLLAVVPQFPWVDQETLIDVHVARLLLGVEPNLASHSQPS